MRRTLHANFVTPIYFVKWKMDNLGLKCKDAKEEHK